MAMSVFRDVPEAAKQVEEQQQAADVFCADLQKRAEEKVELIAELLDDGGDEQAAARLKEAMEEPVSADQEEPQWREVKSLRDLLETVTGYDYDDMDYSNIEEMEREIINIVVGGAKAKDLSAALKKAGWGQDAPNPKTHIDIMNEDLGREDSSEKLLSVNDVVRLIDEKDLRKPSMGQLLVLATLINSSHVFRVDSILTFSKFEKQIDFLDSNKVIQNISFDEDRPPHIDEMAEEDKQPLFRIIKKWALANGEIQKGAQSCL